MKDEWEYKVETKNWDVDQTDYSAAQEKFDHIRQEYLNSMGKSCWELVSVEPVAVFGRFKAMLGSLHFTFMFKKKKSS